MFVDDKKDRTRKLSPDAQEEYYTSKEAAAHPIGVIVDKGKNSVATHQFTDYICPLAILNMIRRRCGDMIASDSLRMEMLWQNYFVTSSGDVGEDTITMTTLGRNILRITRFFDGHTSDKVGVYMRAHKNAISATVAALGAVEHSEEKQDIEEMQCCSSANEEEDDEVVLKKHCRKRRQKKSTRNAFIPGLDCEEDDEVEVEEETPPQKKKKMSEEVNQKNDFPNKRRCTSEKICEKEESTDSAPVETTTEEKAAANSSSSSSSSTSESEEEEEVEEKKMDRVESDRVIPKEIVGEQVISDYAPPLNEEQRKKKQQQQKANMDIYDEVPPPAKKDDGTPEATS
ncbi:hypothetical protein HPB48_003066 [Haemaphysalis longicornis]|uniref:Uncharacterized protein n=1 Tax=Haemaphysalis longicornis TaxID=44386 RepID=A0A9J6FTK9_HAELO|nr:hypothetical protein HPB48_003066 [Haemaphysalis longicornis]